MRNLIELGDGHTAKLNQEDYSKFASIKLAEKALIAGIISSLRPDLIQANAELTTLIKGTKDPKIKFTHYKTRKKIRNELHQLVNKVRRELNDDISSYIHWGT